MAAAMRTLEAIIFAILVPTTAALVDFAILVVAGIIGWQARKLR